MKPLPFAFPFETSGIGSGLDCGELLLTRAGSFGPRGGGRSGTPLSDRGGTGMELCEMFGRDGMDGRGEEEAVLLVESSHRGVRMGEGDREADAEFWGWTERWSVIWIGCCER